VDVNALSVAERRTTAIDARWIPAQALISTAIAAFAPRYKAKGVDLRSFVADGVPALWADPERLGQVLANLLDNSLRHTDPGGRVSVTATVADDELAIAISDTGVGVAPEHLPRLFDRFYRADAARDRQHGGAGIGLSIAKALVEAHDGHIEAHSDGHGTGSTFNITLPTVRTSVR
jgi:signal transduction histidine kinase